MLRLHLRVHGHRSILHEVGAGKVVNRGMHAEAEYDEIRADRRPVGELDVFSAASPGNPGHICAEVKDDPLLLVTALEVRSNAVADDMGKRQRLRGRHVDGKPPLSERAGQLHADEAGPDQHGLLRAGRGFHDCARIREAAQLEAGLPVGSGDRDLAGHSSCRKEEPCRTEGLSHPPEQRTSSRDPATSPSSPQGPRSSGSRRTSRFEAASTRAWRHRT